MHFHFIVATLTLHLLVGEVAGYVCLEALPACRTNFKCDASSGMANANLTTKARVFDAPCSRVFDAETNNILGLANCHVSPE
eukprot:1155866-Pelagomonas_calceolata.AAC.6